MGIDAIHLNGAMTGIQDYNQMTNGKRNIKGQDIRGLTINSLRIAT